jgi:hypothetical protein
MRVTTVPGRPDAGDSDSVTTGSEGRRGLGSTLRGSPEAVGEKLTNCWSAIVCSPAGNGPTRTQPETRPLIAWDSWSPAATHRSAARGETMGSAETLAGAADTPIAALSSNKPSRPGEESHHLLIAPRRAAVTGAWRRSPRARHPAGH